MSSHPEVLYINNTSSTKREHNQLMSLVIWLKYYFKMSELRMYFTLNVDQIIWQKPGYSRFCLDLGFSFQFFVPVMSSIQWPLSGLFQNRHNISIINLTSEVIKNLLLPLALAMIIVYCLKAVIYFFTTLIELMLYIMYILNIMLNMGLSWLCKS